MSWGIPIFVLFASAVILSLAPEEQTLGSGITSVYLHVSLIWTGMIALVLSGALGLLAALRPTFRLETWAQVIGWVGLGFFAAGFAMSAIAAIVNWGGMFWQEPRNATALNVIALTVIVQVAHALLPPTRWRALLHLLPASILVYGTLVTPLVLHPPGAARSSPSFAIQATFLSLFALASMAAAWIAWRLIRRQSKQTLRSSW